MLDGWVLFMGLSGLMGIAIGWWLAGIRLQMRQRSQLNRAILAYINGSDTQLFSVDEMALWSRRDRIAYRVYVHCRNNELARAQMVIDHLTSAQRTTNIERLSLYIGLRTNSYPRLGDILARLRTVQGVERLVFGNLLCAGRWEDAVDFYDREIRRRQGSQREWRLLRLCADVFGNIPIGELELSETEQRLQSLLKTGAKSESSHLARIRSLLDSGVCFVSEMRFLFDAQEFLSNSESPRDGVHHMMELGVRGDWLGGEYEVFRRQVAAAQLDNLLSTSHLSRVRDWMQSQRGYGCSHCGHVRRGFSLICSVCLCLNFGEPQRIASEDSVGDALSIALVDLRDAEYLYWMSLLRPT